MASVQAMPPSSAALPGPPAPASSPDQRGATPDAGGGERLKLIVIDDDPTGSQSVHGCLLLLRWDPDTLAAALRHPSPLLFLLANSRALAPAEARARVGEICRALAPALAAAQRDGVLDRWLLVSRGDSTLRGHFPLEVEEISAALGPFDATFLVPAFLEGGRTTRAGVHRLHGQPVHETPFGRDRLFGYSTSHLPAWVEEKSAGRLPAATVEQISLEELEHAGRGGDGGALEQRLAALDGNPVVAVDAETPAHLASLAALLRRLTADQRGGGPEPGRPRRFLLQSAASLLAWLAELPPQPRDSRALVALRRRDPCGRPLPGLVLVGSHVPLADSQLAALLEEPGCVGLELPVARVHRLLEGPLPDRLLASLEEEWLEGLRQRLAAGLTPVFHTSRGELHCRHAAERRQLGAVLAGVMARLAGRLAPELGYLISKGGITSHTLLADGLAAAAVELQGQLLPGLSLVLAPQQPTTAGMQAPLPVLTVPGNLGDATTLVEVRRAMEAFRPLDPRQACE